MRVCLLRLICYSPVSCVDSVVEFVADALLQSLSFESVVSGSDYSLEKWVDLYPNVQDQRVSTQQKLEREQRIKLMKALHGPPHMGKSLVPKTPSADVTINLVKQTGFEDRVSCVTLAQAQLAWAHARSF